VSTTVSLCTDEDRTKHWLLVKVLSPTQHKIGHFGDPVSWLGIEKQNLTQQKHTLTNQKKCTTTQYKHKLECGLMPNVMAAQPNIGGALCESSVIPFLV